MPNYLQTSNGYLGLVLSTFVEANEYIGGIYSGTTYLGLQIALTFVGSPNTYVLSAQVWANGNQIANYQTLVNLVPNSEAFMTFLYNYNNGNVATGALQEGSTVIDVYFPTSYSYNSVTYNVINTYGFTDPSGANPSFAIEGTYTGQPPFSDTGWDGMWINGAPEPINAVAGQSSATGYLGGTAPIPSYYAESGLTLFHNHNVFINYWYNPYAWYFSIGTPQDYSAHGLNYVQLSEGQSYNTINGLNYALYWISP
ncbi:hypothetical protein [Sulfolobus spindle-shaped virus]|nr:hypothetical protein [Sulfolobus spindle-shaped virus]